MCVDYRPPLPEQLDMVLGTVVDLYRDWDWPSGIWKDYTAPIVRAGAGGERTLQLAGYGMLPRPPHPARRETVRHDERAGRIAGREALVRASLAPHP